MTSNDVEARARAWRHHLHRIPELGFDEHETSAYLAAELAALGCDVATGVGGTGVVASLTRGTGTRSVGLRSELDALPIHEDGGAEHTSDRAGRMHACGHDGHMAMLLAAADALSTDDDLDGTVRFIFQPAEEPGHGARAMIDDGLLDRFPIDQVFALHNLPGTAAGHLHTRRGPIMASEDNFTISVTGRGGHASAPHLLVDPLVVGAEIVVALQHVVARNVDPMDTAVLSCTEFHTDGARNAVPTHVTITGDTRTFTAEVSRRLEHQMRQVSAGVAAAHGATASVVYTREFTPTVNDDASVAVAARAANKVLGADRVDTEAAPIMASEDFGLLTERVPGCMAFLGNGTEAGAGGTPLHSSDYTFNDAILASGIDYLHRVAREALRVP